MAPDSEAVQLTSHPLHILLIDEYDEDRQYWAHRLKMCFPDDVVHEAPSGGAALEMLRARPFDCVVLELVLVDMSAFRVLTYLIPRVSRPEVAVVVLSRVDLPSINELALRNGARACLVKGRTSGEDLAKAIRKALAAVGPTHKEKPGSTPSPHNPLHR